MQANNSKHFPVDQYLHDRVTPATLSLKPLAYDKPLHPSEMPRISTCTDTIADDTNVPTKDDKCSWLDPDDKRRHMTDAEILRLKLNLDDSLLDEKGKEEFLTKTDDLFKILQKYGLKISPHKCQFFKKKIVYMGLEFQIRDSKVCYTPLKDKCKAIRNLESSKTLKQMRAFCGMVNSCHHSYLIYNTY